MCFFIKKFYDDNKKKVIYMIDFLCQIKILLLNIFILLFPRWAWWHQRNSLSVACHPNSGKALVGLLDRLTLRSFTHFSSNNLILKLTNTRILNIATWEYEQI